MSVLNKVENAYLTILRLVVLTGATLALVVAVFLGISSANKLLGAEPKDAVQELVTPQNAPKLSVFIASKNPAEPTSVKPETTKEPEDKIHNQDMETSIKNFSQYFKEVTQDNTDTDKLRAFLLEKARLLPKETQNSYLKSLAEFSADLLKNAAQQKAVIDASNASGTAPVGLIDFNAAIQWHLVQFAEIVDKNTAEVAKKQQEYILGKETGMQNLYIAAGSFGVFLLVVFLFIIIKIERNLRGVSVAQGA